MGQSNLTPRTSAGYAGEETTTAYDRTNQVGAASYCDPSTDSDSSDSDHSGGYSASQQPTDAYVDIEEDRARPILKHASRRANYSVVPSGNSSSDDSSDSDSDSSDSDSSDSSDSDSFSESDSDSSSGLTNNNRRNYTIPQQQRGRKWNEEFQQLCELLQGTEEDLNLQLQSRFAIYRLFL